MILSSLSYKGGVGKTTIAQNLAVAFARQGVKVCIVDADEANISVKWGGVRNEQEDELPKILTVSMTDAKNLAPTVKQLYQDYDVIIIDSPPSYNPISVKIMLMSSIILVPIKPTGRAEIWTASDLLERYENAFMGKDEIAPLYFIINDYDPRPTLHKSFIQIVDEIAEDYESVGRLNTLIHHRTAYGEAGVVGKGVLEFNNPKAKKEIKGITEEVIAISQSL